MSGGDVFQGVILFVMSGGDVFQGARTRDWARIFLELGCRQSRSHAQNSGTHIPKLRDSYHGLAE